MGWSIDSVLWHDVRGYLGDRYAGCCYSVLTSNSPVVVRHRPPELTKEQMWYITHWFPADVRVEFQVVTYEGEFNNIYGRGDMDISRVAHPTSSCVTEDTAKPTQATWVRCPSCSSYYLEDKFNDKCPECGIVLRSSIEGFQEK